MVGRSISGTQKDVDTKSDSDRCVAMAADGLQLSTFRVSKDEPGRRWERHTISMRPPITLVKTFQIQETRGFLKQYAVVTNARSLTGRLAFEPAFPALQVIRRRRRAIYDAVGDDLQRADGNFQFLFTSTALNPEPYVLTSLLSEQPEYRPTGLTVQNLAVDAQYDVPRLQTARV